VRDGEVVATLPPGVATDSGEITQTHGFQFKLSPLFAGR